MDRPLFQFGPRHLREGTRGTGKGNRVLGPCSLGSMFLYRNRIGAINIQSEADKMFDVTFPPGAPTLPVAFPADRSVKRWPPRCDRDPFGDEVDHA
jgi:hypothetical protein